MSFNILSVELSPNPVNVKENYIIRVEIEECTHERLEKYTHAELATYTHKDLAETVLDGRTSNADLASYTVSELSAYTHEEIRELEK